MKKNILYSRHQVADWAGRRPSGLPGEVEAAAAAHQPLGEEGAEEEVEDQA